jgi:hypothetical protein
MYAGLTARETSLLEVIPAVKAHELGHFASLWLYTIGKRSVETKSILVEVYL